MKWRKFNRLLHRDIGYICFGLIIIYSISGIAVNHVDDWNPNYVIEIDTLKISEIADSSLSKDELAFLIIEKLSIRDSLQSSFKSSPNKTEFYFEGKTVYADAETAQVVVETVKDRAVFRETNFLHLNAPKKLWTYVADLFAVALILLAISGSLMIQGKKGITGRGKWLILLGIAIPVFFLLLYF